MRANGSHAQLTTVIAIHDKDGRKTGEREVANYAGILALAHEDGLRSIRTKLVQIPTKENGMVAIATARVSTAKGTFEGIGDADPSNVNRKVAAHLIRMAETRAKARALRDATNIGIVSLEELGELAGEELGPESPQPERPAPSRPKPQPQAANDSGRGAPSAAGPALPTVTEPEFRAMSEAQRGLLFRIAGERGVAPSEQEAWLVGQLGIQELGSLSRAAASQAIDRLRGRKPNGAGHGNGASGAGVVS